MFKSFYPNEWVNSTYEIDFDSLYERGYRTVIFDIDNTLVCHGAPQNEKSLPFLQGLIDKGFFVFFLSNNKEPRVESFRRPLKGKAGYIFKAGKPNPRGYLKAVEITGATIDTTIFVGDQLFTDVWGANLAGIYSILVKPIDKHEEIQIILKRRLEAIVLASYRHRLKKQKKYGLIGNPVNHSRSPFIHSSFARMTGDNLEYKLYQVSNDELGTTIEKLRRDGVSGFNVTVPHKEAIIQYLSKISDAASKIGAVNTVKLTASGYEGINTDYSGFIRSMRSDGVSVKDKECVVLGAGGAARAIIAALITEGASDICVINRTLSRAESLCEDLNKTFETKVCRAIPVDAHNTLNKGVCAFQTTSLGLHGETALITDTSFYEKLSVAYDIVPVKRTNFRIACEKAGVRNFGGISMLVNQAADAYEYFTGKPLKKEYIDTVMERLKND